MLTKRLEFTGKYFITGLDNRLSCSFINLSKYFPFYSVWLDRRYAPSDLYAASNAAAYLFDDQHISHEGAPLASSLSNQKRARGRSESSFSPDDIENLLQNVRDGFRHFLFNDSTYATSSLAYLITNSSASPNSRSGVDYSSSTAATTEPVLKPKQIKARGLLTHVTMADPGEFLVVRGVENRLIVRIPQSVYDLRSTRFYIVILGVGGSASASFSTDTSPGRKSPSNVTRFALKGSSSEITNQGPSITFGGIWFRQDQSRIDLFVFFTVFFSCFFLFLSSCVIIWKIKQAFDLRRARRLHAAEMKSMASRPFASVMVILDDFNSQSQNPIPPKSFSTGGPYFRRETQSVEVRIPFTNTSSYYQQKMDRTGKGRKIIKITVHMIQINCIRTLYFNTDIVKIITTSKEVASSETSSEKTQESKDKTRRDIQVRPSSEDPIFRLRPVAVEPTSDGQAGIVTTLIQLPGGRKAPVRLSLGSTLVSVRHSLQILNYINASFPSHSSTMSTAFRSTVKRRLQPI